MSYIVKEHLVVNKLLKKDRALVDAVSENIITLFGFSFSPRGATLLSVRYEDEDNQLFFLAEKKNYNELSDILYKLARANQFDITIDYVSYGEFCDQGWSYPRNESLYQKIRKLMEENARWKNYLFFSLFFSADSEGTVFPVAALGRKDGKVYNEEIEFVPCELPKDGCWVCDNLCMVFDDNITEDMDPVAIEKIVGSCAEKFPEYTTITPLPAGAHLAVEDLVLKSREDFEALIELYAALCRATNNKCGMLNGFYDLSGKDGRSLYLDINEDGTYTVEMSCV